MTRSPVGFFIGVANGLLITALIVGLAWAFMYAVASA